MHIPDNFLSPPVWASLDIVSIPSVAFLARRAEVSTEEGRIPLLGVLGAFIFAAQTINFPVGMGTSAHLLGGALLACTLGPAAACVVMTAILAIQAFVFQDGGVLALGANVFNMALGGVLAGYLPYRLFGWRWRNGALFAAGAASVLVSAALALGELFLSGIRMPRPLLLVSGAAFLLSAVAEGIITVVVFQALERMNRHWIPAPERPSVRLSWVMAAGVAVLGICGFLAPWALPDAIQRLAAELGTASKIYFHAPFPGYEIQIGGAIWLRRASASVVGIGIVYLCSLLVTKLVIRTRSTECAMRR